MEPPSKARYLLSVKDRAHRILTDERPSGRSRRLRRLMPGTGCCSIAVDEGVVLLRTIYMPSDENVRGLLLELTLQFAGGSPVEVAYRWEGDQ